MARFCLPNKHQVHAYNQLPWIDSQPILEFSEIGLFKETQLVEHGISKRKKMLYRNTNKIQIIKKTIATLKIWDFLIELSALMNTNWISVFSSFESYIFEKCRKKLFIFILLYLNIFNWRWVNWMPHILRVQVYVGVQKE